MFIIYRCNIDIYGNILAWHTMIQLHLNYVPCLHVLTPVKELHFSILNRTCFVSKKFTSSAVKKLKLLHHKQNFKNRLFC